MRTYLLEGLHGVVVPEPRETGPVCLPEDAQQKHALLLRYPPSHDKLMMRKHNIRLVGHNTAALLRSAAGSPGIIIAYCKIPKRSPMLLIPHC